MITREEVLKLATLSRLALSEEEVVKLQSEMGSILAYVDKLKSATASGVVGGKGGEIAPVMSVNKNVMRDDVNPHESGIYTEKLIKSAPQSQNNFIKVKKIL